MRLTNSIIPTPSIAVILLAGVALTGCDQSPPGHASAGGGAGEDAVLPGPASSETEITLGVLNAVHADSGMTQRSVARQLGIALGLTNAYLKRCVKKGLIKVTQAPPNRYAYYLTPKGFAEKSRLTTEYLTSSFNFFRRARNQFDGLIAAAQAEGWRRLALYGASELAEVAVLCAADGAVEIVGIADADFRRRSFVGLIVAPRLDGLEPFDAVLFTTSRGAQACYDALAADYPPGRILAPPLLHIVRRE